MATFGNIHFNGWIHDPSSLDELSNSQFEQIKIEKFTYDQRMILSEVICDSIIIENCRFKSALVLDKCKIRRLQIISTVFENVLILGSSSTVDEIYLNTVDAFDSVDLHASLTNFKCFELKAKKLNLKTKRVGGIRFDSVHILLQDNRIDITEISFEDRRIEVELKNNTMKTFGVKETKELSLLIRDNNDFGTINLSDIEDVGFNGLYQSPIKNLTLTDCGISKLTEYGEGWDDDYVETNKIDEVHLHNCTTLKKIFLEIPRSLKFYVEECNFDKPLEIKSVYKRIHVTPSTLAIGDKNSGDILVEHINVNLNFTGTNFSTVTVNGSGINALDFDTFSNHGKINFINSNSAKEEFLLANHSSNHLTAVDSILDNINFHFLDLNKFRYIQFINTNILGMQLFHYPVRLADYSENLNITPSLNSERDFNINAKFTYNQLRLLAERNGDTDKSVEYRSLEQNYLRRTKNNLADELLLLLNELSNWHGRNWLLGVFFTLFAGLISFAGYQGSLGIFIFCDSNWLADYIRYIATYPKLQLGNYEKQGTALTDLARMFGIIFMGYGVFQTIAAFRKYGKK